VGQGPGGTSYSVPIQTLLFFTALSLPAGGAAADDGLHAHRHRAVAAAPGAGHAGRAAQPGDHRPEPVPDLLRDEPDLRQGVRPGLEALLAANQIAFAEALERARRRCASFMLKQTRQADVQLFAAGQARRPT
jgi:flagellar biosynthetic protein FliP